MSTKTSTLWSGNMTFTAKVNGHDVIMDADTEWGGNDAGPRPKPLLLAALSGCSGMDVVSLLEKMRVENYTLRIDVEADSTADHPITYHTIWVSYHFTGEQLPHDKLLKSVKLSTEKYCGVQAMLNRAATIIAKVYVNGEEISQ